MALEGMLEPVKEQGAIGKAREVVVQRSPLQQIASPPDFGDVFYVRHKKVLRIRALHVNVGHGDTRPHHVAASVEVALLRLEMGHFAADNLAYLLHVARQVIAVSDLCEMPALEFVWLVAQHPGEGFIHRYIVAHLIEDGHADGGVVKGALEQFVVGNHHVTSLASRRVASASAHGAQHRPSGYRHNRSPHERGSVT